MWRSRGGWNAPAARRAVSWMLGGLVLSATAASAATRVNVMPNRQVRPGVSVPVFGNAGNLGGIGNGTATGEAYTWSFSSLTGVVANHDGNLSGVVANDKNIVENVSFTLAPGQTRGIVTATLNVGGTTDSLEIDVVATTDPISDTPLEALAVDVNIAIENGKRFMYLSQQADGLWPNGNGQVGADCGTTAFSVWAFANSGHVPTDDINDDIYAEFVQKGIERILLSSLTPAFGNQTNLGGEGIPATPDFNGNGRIAQLCPGTGQHGNPQGYAAPIAAAAIMAAWGAAPDTVYNGPGLLTGSTYRVIIQDAIEWTAFAQSEAGVPARGGWAYAANAGGDTSVDSWHYVAMEGFISTFGGAAAGGLENVIREAERRISSSQRDDGSAAHGQFGYTNFGNCLGAGCNATTAGGLSGLVLSTINGRAPAHLNGALAGTFGNVAGRKTAARNQLGAQWDVGGNTWAGNKPNFYAMWTTARALRLDGTSSLTNGGVTFDWETGEAAGAPGVIPPAGGLREGYFPFLVRTQGASGEWAVTVNGGNWTQNLNTAWGVLILQPTVFGPPPCLVLNCDDNSACTFDSCDPALGRCVNTPIDCSDGNACTTDSCNPANGCGHTPIVCNDNSACTQDACNIATGCEFQPITCDDNSACTTDSCNPATGCAATPISCDDFNACTADFCDARTGCGHTPISCNDDNACTIDSCNPASGCGYQPVVCNDGNGCTDDVCDPASGCGTVPNNDPCDADNNVCTDGDRCAGGQCVPGGQLPCDDGNVCTTDGCDPVGGCMFQPNVDPCDDGNACTTSDTCSDRQCVGGAAPDCNDRNVCTTDACDPATGCTNTDNTDPCDDGNACTTDDTCGGGACIGGEPPNCDDQDRCTIDTCDPDVGCENSDDQCPICGDATADPSSIWPPNHKFVPVSIDGVTDPQGDEVIITYTSIRQDEPTNTFGDGNHCPDGLISEDDLSASVRAERSGTKKVPGDGRVYHIEFVGTDADGFYCEGEVTLCVPHDQRPGATCVDQGPLYDSLTCP